jgi:general stress protein YciG
MALTAEERRVMSKMGSRGGKARMKNLTPEERRAIGRKGALVTNNKRWGTPIPKDDPKPKGEAAA